MKSQLLADVEGLRTFAVIFDKEDEPQEGLTRFAEAQQITGASLTAIGAFSEATLAYFDRGKNEYLDIPIHEQVEVLSLVGDIAVDDGRPAVHAHVVVGHRNGSTSGGHLKSASVFPTLEVVISETPSHLCKRYDPETGLTLIDPET